MILADTSVWIDHLRTSNATLRALLNQGRVLTHPFIIGELACGYIRNRPAILGLLDSLQTAVVATDAEALALIERHALPGKGLGYIDVHLLVSAQLTAAKLWTLDKRLAKVTKSIEA